MVNERFVKIPIEIFEALSRLNLSAYEARVFRYVERQTFGWHAVRLKLNISKVARGIEMHRQHVQRALNSLAARNIIELTRHADKGVFVSIVRNTGLWLDKVPAQKSFNFKIAASGEKK